MYNKYVVDTSYGYTFSPYSQNITNVLASGSTTDPYFIGLPQLKTKTRSIEDQQPVGYIDISGNDLSTKYGGFYIDYFTSISDVPYPVGAYKIKVFMIGASGNGSSAISVSKGLVVGGASGGSGGMQYFELNDFSATESELFYGVSYSIVIGDAGTGDTSFTDTGFITNPRFVFTNRPDRTNTITAGTNAFNVSPDSFGGSAGISTNTFGYNITSLNGSNGNPGSSNSTPGAAVFGAYYNNGIYDGTFFPESSEITYDGTSGFGNSTVGIIQGPGQQGMIRIYFEYY